MTSLGVPAQASTPPIPGTLASAITLAPSIAPGAPFTRDIALPWRANTIGVTYAGAEQGVSIQARIHDANGWSGWATLDPTDAHPDGAELKHASFRVSTDPAWIGSADRVNVRIAARTVIRAARLELVNTLGDARPPSIWDRMGRALRSFFTMQPASAQPSTPRIITRRQWGANESWKRAMPDYAPEVKMVFIHHTDNVNSYSRSASAAIVRSIYHYHVFSQGWNDIGYNFLVDRYGQIFEGRFGGVDKPVIGAHTMGFNTNSTGISLIGNFTSTTPTPSMLRSLQYVVAWKMDIHHVPPIGRVNMYSYGNPRYARGRIVAFNRISGHRDAYPTACPGNVMARKLPWLRSTVETMGNPKIYLPSWTSTILRNDGDGVRDTATFTATLSRTATWAVTMTGAGGVVQRTFTGTGNRIAVKWNATDEHGILLPTARYSWRVTARNSAAAARPAAGLLYVVTTHPDGTLLSDANGRYAVAQGNAAPISDVIAHANFGEIIPAVPTGANERNRYLAATAPRVRTGTLLRSSDPATGAVLHYIWDGTQLRKFGATSDANGNVTDTFSVLGYSDQAAIAVDPTVLATLQPSGPDVTDTTVHPVGALIRRDDGVLFVMDVAGLRPIGELARRSSYRAQEIVPATPADVDATHPVLDTNPIAVRDGTLAVAADGTRWMLFGDAKRRFADATMYGALGFVDAWLLPATTAELDAFSVGTQIG